MNYFKINCSTDLRKKVIGLLLTSDLCEWFGVFICFSVCRLIFICLSFGSGNTQTLVFTSTLTYSVKKRLKFGVVSSLNIHYTWRRVVISERYIDLSSYSYFWRPLSHPCSCRRRWRRVMQQDQSEDGAGPLSVLRGALHAQGRSASHHKTAGQHVQVSRQ